MWNSTYPIHRLGDVLVQQRRAFRPAKGKTYHLLGVRWYGAGCHIHQEASGDDLNAPTLSALQPGDVVYNKMWASKGAFGIVGVAQSGAVATSEYPLFRPRDGISARYLEYVFRQPRFWALAKAQSVGTTGRARLNPEDFLSMPIPLPAPDEQRAIAALLGSAEDAVSATAKLFVQLESTRRAVMTQLFARGLPGRPTKLKKTRIGNIPAGWDVMEMDALATIGNGSTPDRGRQEYWTEGTIPWVSSGKVNDIRITSPTALITSCAVRDRCLKVLPRGTVLVAMIGQGKTRGMVARLEIDACINQNVAYAIPRERLDALFLFHYLRAQYDRLRSSGRGSNQDALNCRILKAYLVPVPPIEEQEAISRVGEVLDHRLGAERAYLSHLQDVKCGLAQALLSGRVRVPSGAPGGEA